MGDFVVETNRTNKYTSTILANERCLSGKVYLNFDKVCDDFRSHHK